MSKVTQHPAFVRVRDGLQAAEEIQGLEGREYVDFMMQTALLASGRARNYALVEPDVRSHYQDQIRRLITQLQMDLSELNQKQASTPNIVPGPSLS